MTAPVVDTRALATRLVALRVLKDAVAAADTATRAALLDALLVGDRATAAVTGPDGEPVTIGAVTATKPSAGSTTAAVTDLNALVHWCRDHAPSEAEVVWIVRPAFQRKLLDACKRDGGWHDTITGEIVAVDGITVTPPTGGQPGLMVKPADNADAEVRAAWADGRLRFADLAAIEDGTE